MTINDDKYKNNTLWLFPGGNILMLENRKIARVCSFTAMATSKIDVHFGPVLSIYCA